MDAKDVVAAKKYLDNANDALSLAEDLVQSAIDDEDESDEDLEGIIEEISLAQDHISTAQRALSEISLPDPEAEEGETD